MSPPTARPAARRPTIADVARRAGVSAAAVSFAVNDRPGVSPGTRERILAAARELGWQPSASARALTEARTRAIGLVLARSAAQLEGDSFFVRFLSGIERALTAADYALLLQIVPGDGVEALPAYERLAAAGRVDGFLLTDIETGDPRFALLERRRDAGRARRAARPARLPVPVDRDAPRRGDRAGGRAPRRARARADRVLLRAGRVDHVRVREAAWREALAAAGLAPGPLGARRRTTARGGAGAAARAARPRSCARATRWRSRSSPRRASSALSVPDDVSRDRLRRLDRWPRWRRPALTSVRVDYAEFGAAAASRAAGRDRRRAARRPTRRRRPSWSCAARPRGAGGGRPRTAISAATTMPALIGPTTSITCSARSPRK